MKRTLKMLLCAMLLGMSTSVMAQLPIEMQGKASKAARKEAKTLAKEGWKVAPGGPSIDRQLDRAYQIEYETGAGFQPKYVTYTAMSVGEVYDAAKMSAEAIARQGLAGKISSEIMSVVEVQIKSDQKAKQQAASIVKTCQESTAKMHQNLGRIITSLELYRTLKNGNTEVMIRAAYDMEQGKKRAVDQMNKDLEEQGYEYRVALDENM